MMKISLKEVSKEFGQGSAKTLIFSHVDLEFNKDSSYAILGNSGSGKSSLLYIIGQLENPSSGKVLVSDDYDLNPFRQKFSFVFQEHNLLPELTVAENLALPLLIQNIQHSIAIKRSLDLLLEFDLLDKKDFYVFQLSGGQRQRIAIMRAILCGAHFILADEPTASLDEENANVVINFLLKIKRDFEIGLIVCSHDANVYSKMDYNIMVQDKKVFTIKTP